MKILAIDTSNQTLAIGIMEDDKVLGQIQTTANKNHSITLMPNVQSLMQQVNLKPADLDRIVVAQGPGSYTGLRIGVTTAKTLAYTLRAELVGVSSLAVLAANCVEHQGLIVPLFDARRKNVYAGIYRWQEGRLVNQFADRHIAIADLLHHLSEQQDVLFVGEDVAKFTEEITSELPNATVNQISQHNYPNGIVLAELGRNAQPETDIHGFLPHYLKRVEAEENWLATHEAGDENYVEKI